MEAAENTQKKTWDWKNRKPNNILPIEAKEILGFFRWWCIWMRPLVDLTEREVDVMSHLLYYRWKLSKVISDPAVLDSQLMSNDTLSNVIKDCKISRQHFYVLASSMRKKNAISRVGINPRLIPNIRKDDTGTFQFLLLFKYKPEEEENEL